MTNALLSGLVLIGVATLIVAVRTLRSSQRAEGLGESWYELLRDQQERLQLLREERRMLVEELERESRERRQLMEILKGEGPQLAENLERERKKRTEIMQRAEQQEQEQLRLEQLLKNLQEELERRNHQEAQRQAEVLEREQKKQSQIEQKMEQLEQEHQRLTEDLGKEHEQRVEIQRQAEQRDQERIRLERELQRLRAKLDSRKRAPVSKRAEGSEEPPLWRHRPILVVGLLSGALVMWFVSLMVALSLLAS